MVDHVHGAEYKTCALRLQHALLVLALVESTEQAIDSSGLVFSDYGKAYTYTGTLFMILHETLLASGHI
jgi:hypothetical protein